MNIVADMVREMRQHTEWMQKAVGGSVNCWLLIVKKIRCNWLHGMKKKDEKKRRGTPNAGQPHDQECGRRNRFIAQTHKTDSLEWRNTSFGGNEERCGTFEEM